MNQKFAASAIVIAASVILWAARPVFDEGISGVFIRGLSDLKQTGIAVQLYSVDHEGRIPRSLDELIPNYISNPTIFSDAHLTTPNAVLAEFSPESIILFRVATDKLRRQTCTIILHADLSGEITVKSNAR